VNLFQLASLPLDTPAMIVIAMLILVLFGIKVLPHFMRGLGKGVDEFRNASEEFAKRLSRLSEDAYWNQYDAEDKSPKWKLHVPSASKEEVSFKRHAAWWKRLRVLILPIL
jgi:sec-independent protein translocase protein TatA